jgi:hypothetical protein
MSLPSPETGLVLSYAYLWHHKHQAGREEGRKNRPSVIVLTVERPKDGATLVTVLPITHAEPTEPEAAVELPVAVKRRLGPDDTRSWVMVHEGDEFVWPGYDLVKIPHTEGYDYGFLPPRFFKQVVDAFVAFHRTGRGRRFQRD